MDPEKPSDTLLSLNGPEGNVEHVPHSPPAWRARLEAHLRAELAESGHPRYARERDGGLACARCGRLSPTADEVREGMA